MKKVFLNAYLLSVLFMIDIFSMRNPYDRSELYPSFRVPNQEHENTFKITNKRKTKINQLIKTAYKANQQEDVFKIREIIDKLKKYDHKLPENDSKKKWLKAKICRIKKLLDKLTHNNSPVETEQEEEIVELPIQEIQAVQDNNTKQEDLTQTALYMNFLQETIKKSQNLYSRMVEKKANKEKNLNQLKVAVKNAEEINAKEEFESLKNELESAQADYNSFLEKFQDLENEMRPQDPKSTQENIQISNAQTKSPSDKDKCIII